MRIRRLVALLFLLSLLTYGLLAQPKALAISWWPCGNPVAAGTATPSPTPTPTLVNVSSAQSSSSSPTVNLPASLQDGDVVYGITANTGSTPVITNGGWFVSQNVTDGGNNGIFWKRYKTTDGTTVSFGNLSGNSTAVCMAAYRGTDTNWDFNNRNFGTVYVQASFGTAPTGNAITTVANNDLIVYMNGWLGGSIISASAAGGFTQDVTLPSTATFAGCDIEHELLATAGSTGAVHNTLSANANSVVALFSLRP